MATVNEMRQVARALRQGTGAAGIGLAARMLNEAADRITSLEALASDLTGQRASLEAEIVRFVIQAEGQAEAASKAALVAEVRDWAAVNATAAKAEQARDEREEEIRSIASLRAEQERRVQYPSDFSLTADAYYATRYRVNLNIVRAEFERRDRERVEAARLAGAQ